MAAILAMVAALVSQARPENEQVSTFPQ